MKKKIKQKKKEGFLTKHGKKILFIFFDQLFVKKVLYLKILKNKILKSNFELKRNLLQICNLVIFFIAEIGSLIFWESNPYA